MKRWTWFLPAAVALALIAGFLRARWRAGDASLPSFARVPPPVFAELRAPIGEHALRGRVVDIDGAPVAGVSLYARSNDVPQWVTSNADGRFELVELAPGAIEVVVLAWGHPPRTQVLAVGADEVEIVLLPATVPPPPLPDFESAPVTGRVAHPIGGRWSDPEGYEVVFLPRAPVQELGAAVERRVQTDARGFFVLEDLALGAYTVRVLPSWARGGSWPDLATPELADFDHERDEIGSNIFPLRCGALEISVRNPDGEPIEGALVLLRDAERASRVWLPQATDPLGRARILDLPPGEYALLIRAGEAQPPEFALEIVAGEIQRPAIPPLSVRKREAR